MMFDKPFISFRVEDEPAVAMSSIGLPLTFILKILNYYNTVKVRWNGDKTR